MNDKSARDDQRYLNLLPLNDCSKILFIIRKLLLTITIIQSFSLANSISGRIISNVAWCIHIEHLLTEIKTDDRARHMMVIFIWNSRARIE